jgi:asparagine synthase (glutamine-hydrolysing)
MSGIAGIIHFDGAVVTPGLVEGMTSAMPHRGPDGIQHWVKGPVALGQCMLRTTPESLEEHQPLANEDESLVLVMDGRVDNWEELRRELLGKGTVLRDHSDAELVLRAYEVWGRECLPHIDGDFALVIWDARRQEAFCARDRMGIKPFHYHWDGKTLAFASELHPILALPWVKEEPNEGMLAEWLVAEWYSRTETLWNGIQRLVAAHRMVVGNGGLQTELYWMPDLSEPLMFRTDEEYIEHYREVLFDSVRRLSRSHLPVAFDVSGGLDSSASFCVAEYLRRRGELPAPAIEGHTFYFQEKDGDAYELNYARAVGEYLGLSIQEVPPSMMPPSWYVERAHAKRDFTGFPSQVMSLSLSQQAAARGCRVRLTGEGGDNWLSGSRAYYAEGLAQAQWQVLYDCLVADVKTAGGRQAASWLIRQGVLQLLPHSVKQHLRRLIRGSRNSGTESNYYWLSPKMQEAIRLRSGDTPVPRSGKLGQQQMLRVLYDAFYVQGMELIGGLDAECGIETRHPFHDRRFVQYAFSTPTRLRLRGNRTKYIHVRALQDFMPAVILGRGNKAGFSIAFRQQLDRMVESLKVWPGSSAFAKIISLARTIRRGTCRYGFCGVFTDAIKPTVNVN